MQSKPSLPALAKAGSEIAQFYFNSRRVAYFGALLVALLIAHWHFRLWTCCGCYDHRNFSVVLS